MTFLRSTDFAVSSSTTRFRLLGRVPTGAAALMLGVSALAMMSGGARANCAPAGADDAGILHTCDNLPAAPTDDNFNALAGDDTVNITGGPYGFILGGDGNDTLNLNGGSADSIQGDVSASGSGNDIINLNSGTAGHVDGNAGNDLITLNGATVTGNIQGSGGNDTIDLLSGQLENALGGEGDDVITLDGATATNNIAGGMGNDVIDILSGVAEDVLGNEGDDTITLSGVTASGFVQGDAGEDSIALVGGGAFFISGGTENDTILLFGSTGSVLGEEGDDTITLLFSTAGASGGDGNDIITISNTTGNSVTGGLGDDIIDITNSAFTGDINGDTGNDTITLNGVSVGGSVAAGDGEDVVELIGGLVDDSVHGSNGNDQITLNGTSVGLLITGDAGNDTISLLSGSAFNVLGGSGNDTITMDGASLAGLISGDEGNDIINLLSGSLVNGGGSVGNDTVTLNGASVVIQLSGGDGDDVIALLSGSVGLEVLAGTGNDTVTLAGAAIGSTVSGGEGNDLIHLISGTAGSASGGAGDDAITLNGAGLIGNIDGDGGNDVITLVSGASGAVTGGDGEDVITLNGALVAEVSGGVDNDVISLVSGSTVADVFGGAGEDAVTLNGASIGLNIFGGSENDVIVLQSGSVGASVWSDQGDDTITLNGAIVGGLLSAGTGDDVIDLTSGSYGGVLRAGSGSDTVTIMSGFDLATITSDFDGGDGTDTGDGFIDLLDIDQSGTLTGVNVINWEIINLNAVDIVVAGGSMSTSAEDGFGLFLNASTLDLGGIYGITGDVTIDGTSVLQADTPGGTGVYSISGDLINGNLVDLSDGSGAGDMLSIGGNYTSSSDLWLDVALDATEAGDSLVIVGDIFGTPTGITFTDVAAANPPSFTGTGPGNGIVVVDNSAGGFILDGDFIFDPVAHPTGEILKVPFVYMLSLESDDILYLQSDVLAQVYGYAILAEVMREDMPTLRERLGDRRYNGPAGDGTDNSGAAGGGVGWDNGGIWARIEGGKRTNEHEGDFTTGEWDASRVEAEVGVDIPMDVGGGLGVFGVSAHFIQGFANANSGLTPDPDIAEVDTTGFGAGLSFAWFPGGGFYADVQGRLTAWDADVEVDNRNIDQDVNAIGWGASLEVGNRIGFGNTAVTPRGRAVYTDVNFKSFTDDDGVDVSQDDSASVVIEGGVTVEQMFPDNGVSIFADASVSHDLLRDSSIDASGFTFESGLEDTWGTLSIGGSMETGQGTSAYIAADVSSPFGSTFGDSIGYGLRAGIRVDF